MEVNAFLIICDYINMEKQYFNNILSKLMLECDIDNSTLSKQTNIPLPTITRLRHDKNINPTISSLKPIADFFQITVDELMGFSSLSHDRIPGTHSRFNYITSIIPIINWQDVISYIQNSNEFINNNNLDWISSEKKLEDTSFAIKVPHDAFALFFKKNSLVLINYTQSIAVGDLIFIQPNQSESIICKKILTDGHELFLKSIDPKIKGIQKLMQNDIIIGKVIEIRYPTETNNLQKVQAIKQNQALNILKKITP